MSLDLENLSKKYIPELALCLPDECNTNNTSNKPKVFTWESPISVKAKNTQDFVPFINERDGLGRLINIQSSSPKKERILPLNSTWLGNELRKYVHTRLATPKHSMSLTKLLNADSPSPEGISSARVPKTFEDEYKPIITAVFGNDKPDTEDKSLTFTNFKLNSKVLEKSIKYPKPSQDFDQQSNFASFTGEVQTNPMLRKCQSQTKFSLTNIMQKNSSSFMSPDRENNDRRIMRRIERMPTIGYYNIEDINSIKPRKMAPIIKSSKEAVSASTSIMKYSSEPILPKLNLKQLGSECVMLDTTRTDKSMKGPDFSKQLSRPEIIARYLIHKKHKRDKNRTDYNYNSEIKDYDKIGNITQKIYSQNKIISNKPFHKISNNKSIPLELQAIEEMRMKIMRKHKIPEKPLK